MAVDGWTMHISCLRAASCELRAASSGHVVGMLHSARSVLADMAAGAPSRALPQSSLRCSSSLTMAIRFDESRQRYKVYLVEMIEAVADKSAPR